MLNASKKCDFLGLKLFLRQFAVQSSSVQFTWTVAKSNSSGQLGSSNTLNSERGVEPHIQILGVEGSHTLKRSQGSGATH